MKTALLTFVVLCLAVVSRGDEGLWLFNQPPRDLLQQRYHFDASYAWLDHLQKSSVRFTSGGSGSFVSADGLVISSHQAGAEAVQGISASQKNFFRDGFSARNPAEEIKCPGLELDVLESVEDVTARINAAVTNGADIPASFAARRGIIAQIEKESLERTGLRSEVAPLWQGGAYQLQRFKRYIDVRLAFTPEQQIACYGGEADEFEFPRYNFDVCLFRAYENGKPAKIKHFLGFSPVGPREGELVFAAGHPESTDRLLTVAELRERRDSSIPYILNQLRRQEILLGVWEQAGEENERRVRERLCGIQKDCRRYEGEIAGLLDPEFMAAKVKAETDFKAQPGVTNHSPGALAAYDRIAAATGILQGQMRRFELLERGRAFDCESFRIAKTLLRAADESAKTNGERLPEFSDSRKAALELSLFSPKPIYPDLEILKLTDALTFAAGELRVEFPLMAGILAGKSPHDRAVELINGTRVRDVAFRHQLYDGGVKAVLAANDPMIELARLVDLDARELRKVFDEQSEARQQAHAAINRARKALSETPGYPDATASLRLSFGTVKGFTQDGSNLPPFILFSGLYERARLMKDRPPFDLPSAWERAKGRIEGGTRFHFASTADIAPGSSGSPVVNRKGELVGLVIDGNRQSLGWEFAYDERQGRAVSTDSAAILESLKKVYGAKELAQELINGKMPTEVEKTALAHELLMSVQK